MEEAILRLYKEILELKKLLRTGWVERGVPRPESVAAHSFAVALLAAVFAELKGVDVLDAVRMALIHDLPEALIGDLTPKMKEERGADELEKLERKVFEDLAKYLPRGVGSKYLDAWLRYSRCEDAVAKLVRDLDKLEMGLQAIAYVKEGYRDAVEIYESALRELKDEELRRILKAAGKGLI